MASATQATTARSQTDTHKSPRRQKHTDRDFALTELVLISSSLGRSANVGALPGHVRGTQEVEYDASEEGVAYLVTTKLQFADSDGADVASIDCAHRLTYIAGRRPDTAEIEAFERNVMMHVTPYVREYVSSTTTRLGMPTFVLPLLRHPD